MSVLHNMCFMCLNFEVSNLQLLKFGSYGPYKNIQVKVNKRQKLSVEELWFLCTALLNNVLYQWLKFAVDSFYSLGYVP